jgi:hypothetical protein
MGNEHEKGAEMTTAYATAKVIDDEQQADDEAADLRKEFGYKAENPRQALFIMLDEPDSSLVARITSSFVMILILLSSLTFVIETMPEYKTGSCVDLCTKELTSAGCATAGDGNCLWVVAEVVDDVSVDASKCLSWAGKARIMNWNTGGHHRPEDEPVGDAGFTLSHRTDLFGHHAEFFQCSEHIYTGELLKEQDAGTIEETESDERICRELTDDAVVVEYRVVTPAVLEVMEVMQVSEACEVSVAGSNCAFTPGNWTCQQTHTVVCADATTPGCELQVATTGIAGGFRDACAELSDLTACGLVDADTSADTKDCAFTYTGATCGAGCIYVAPVAPVAPVERVEAEHERIVHENKMLNVCEFEPNDQMAILHAFETICIVSFTIEYVLRLATCTQRPRADKRFLTYFLKPFNIIDLVSILPFYIELLLGGRTSLSVLRMLRMSRIFRVLKVGNFMHELQLFVEGYRRSRDGLTLLLCMLLLYLCVFGAILYLIEYPGQTSDCFGNDGCGHPECFQDYDDEIYGKVVGWDMKIDCDSVGDGEWGADGNANSKDGFGYWKYTGNTTYLDSTCRTCCAGCVTRGFTSITTTWYFILATMTTVGYGDHYPTSPLVRSFPIQLPMPTSVFIAAPPPNSRHVIHPFGRFLQLINGTRVRGSLSAGCA